MRGGPVLKGRDCEGVDREGLVMGEGCGYGRVWTWESDMGRTW